MKWLKSTSPKRWTLSAGTKQFIVPAESDNGYLQMSDEDYAVVSTQPVVASLIKNKGFLVLNEEPAELKNTIPALQNANADLVSELADTKAKLAQTEAALAAKQKELEDLNAKTEAALAAKQKELEDLDAKASGIIAEKDATITKLEKQVKKLSKNDD